MKALDYHGPGQRSWDTVDDPTIIDPTDIVARIDSSTVCGTDLHILQGYVPETKPGTVHRFPLADTMSAYDTFADAASTNALKVVLQGSQRDPSSNGHIAASLVAGAA